MRPNPQETADLVTFTEEILNGKLHFLCNVNEIKWISCHFSSTSLPYSTASISMEDPRFESISPVLLLTCEVSHFALYLAKSSKLDKCFKAVILSSLLVFVRFGNTHPPIIDLMKIGQLFSWYCILVSLSLPYLNPWHRLSLDSKNLNRSLWLSSSLFTQ